MTENTTATGGSLFFALPPAAPRPPRPRRQLVVDRTRLERLDADGLAAELTLLFGRIQDQTPAQMASAERAPDGTLAVKSLIAVCLIGAVGKAFGRPRLVSLAGARREELGSIGGLARLIHSALDQLRRGAA